MLALAVLGPRARIRLRPYEVTVRGSPAGVVEMFERKVLEGADVESARPGEIVARFAGKAGPFAYRTRELVSFTDRTVTFEHLDGPFDQCLERFLVSPGEDGSTVCHEGTFTMRWGLAGWLFGLAVVRPLFERVVAGELDRAAAHAPEPRPEVEASTRARS